MALSQQCRCSVPSSTPLEFPFAVKSEIDDLIRERPEMRRSEDGAAAKTAAAIAARGVSRFWGLFNVLAKSMRVLSYSQIYFASLIRTADYTNKHCEGKQNALKICTSVLHNFAGEMGNFPITLFIREISR